MTIRRPVSPEDTKATLVPATDNQRCRTCRHYVHSTAGRSCRLHYATPMDDWDDNIKGFIIDVHRSKCEDWTPPTLEKALFFQKIIKRKLPHYQHLQVFVDAAEEYWGFGSVTGP